MRQLSKIAFLTFLFIISCKTKQVTQKKEVNTLSDLLIRPHHLPKNFRLGKNENGACKTTKAQALIKGRGLRYLKRAVQTIEDDSGGRWVVQTFSTSFDLKEKDRKAIKAFNGSAERNFLNPEEITFHKRFVILLCNGFKSPWRDWYRGYLKKNFALEAKWRERVYEEQLEKGLAYFWAQQYKVAAPILRKSIDDSQSKKVAHFLLAEIAMQAREYSQAIKEYTSYLQLEANLLDANADWAANHGMALALAQQGRLAKSIEVFKEAIRLAEKLNRQHLLALSYYDIACAYAELNYQKKAFEFLEKGIRLNHKFKTLAKKDLSFRQLKNNQFFLHLTN